ncbi:IS21 family transposase, partial [Staphylococcus pseudintermedius]
VSKESLVNFRKVKYSVHTTFIREDDQLIFNELTDDLTVYVDAELIRTHHLSEKKFKHVTEDMGEILKSDAFKHKDDQEILTYIKDALLKYDEG